MRFCNYSTETGSVIPLRRTLHLILDQMYYLPSDGQQNFAAAKSSSCEGVRSITVSCDRCKMVVVVVAAAAVVIVI